MSRVQAKESPHVSRASTPKKDKYFAKTIGKTFRILEVFRQSPEPLSLNQVTQRVRGAKSSVFRVIHTLQVLGYLDRNGADQYRLSPIISSQIPNQLTRRLIEFALPAMTDLNREFRETVSLAVLFANHIEVVRVMESPQKVQMGNIVGSIIPPHASSLGKSITAFLSEPRRDHLLRAYGMVPITPSTITDELAFHKELDQVRAQGYAVDMEESALGGCCFGAPIFDEIDQAVAAVSVSIPKMRLDNEQRVVSAVRAAAAAISKALKSR
jgi:IclR family acetate operon transcriptional repressor